MLNDRLKTGFADRMKTSADARQAMLEKLRPRAARTNPLHDDRAADRTAALRVVREERANAKALRREVSVAREQAEQQARIDTAEAALQAKRGARKQRKQLSAAEAKAKRDAKYAARQARR